MRSLTNLTLWVTSGLISSMIVTSWPAIIGLTLVLIFPLSLVFWCLMTAIGLNK